MCCAQRVDVQLRLTALRAAAILVASNCVRSFDKTSIHVTPALSAANRRTAKIRGCAEGGRSCARLMTIARFSFLPRTNPGAALTGRAAFLNFNTHTSDPQQQGSGLRFVRNRMQRTPPSCRDEGQKRSCYRNARGSPRASWPLSSISGKLQIPRASNHRAWNRSVGICLVGCGNLSSIQL